MATPTLAPPAPPAPAPTAAAVATAPAVAAAPATSTSKKRRLRETTLAIVALAALGPAIFGSTYLVTTEMLPPGRPMLAGLLRALPAGLGLIAGLALIIGRQALPSGSWWWKSAILGLVNIGLFFPFLFIGAYRLPGGVGAVIGALGPFVVILLSYPILGLAPRARSLLAAGVGLVGVAMLVLRADARLDPLGLLAMTIAVLIMAVGTVLGKKWGTPPVTTRNGNNRMLSLLTLTGWQLAVGGLFLVPVTLVIEGMPSTVSATNVLGWGYLALFGGVIAYALWFLGVSRLRAAQASMLALLTPIVAAMLGWIVLDQRLNALQLLGVVFVLGSLALGTLPPLRPHLTGARPTAENRRGVVSPTGPPTRYR